MKVKISKSSRSTQLHGKHFSAQEAKGCRLFLLKGPLGSGKTEWVRGFVNGFLKKSTNVTSPSYSLVNIYGTGRKKIYHVDLYRLKSADDLESIGFWDFLTSNNTVIVEWGDMLPPVFPNSTKVTEIEFTILGKSHRQISTIEVI
jgi:tRNA threonylcarbamoyladenosine biosynthesis protein TsaE